MDSELAHCRGRTWLFFSENEVHQEIAKKMCVSCPVLEACLSYAFETDQEYGVWGGLTAAERHRQRRAAIPGGTAPVQVTYTTNARSTGATCSAGRHETGWSVICRPHNAVASAASRTIAEFAVSRPEEWCPTCRRVAQGELPKLTPARELC